MGLVGRKNKQEKESWLERRDKGKSEEHISAQKADSCQTDRHGLGHIERKKK